MDHHLAGEEPGNRRNGYGKKTVISSSGRVSQAGIRSTRCRAVLPLIPREDDQRAMSASAVHESNYPIARSRCHRKLRTWLPEFGQWTEIR
jgi:hypothetical protein